MLVDVREADEHARARIPGAHSLPLSRLEEAELAVPEAVGTSLVAVTAFRLTTTGSYAAAGLVAWGMAGIFIAGCVAGAADAGVRSPDPGGRLLRAGAQPRAGRLRAIRW